MVHFFVLSSMLLRPLASFNLRNELKFEMSASHGQQAGEGGCIPTEGWASSVRLSHMRHQRISLGRTVPLNRPCRKSG